MGTFLTKVLLQIPAARQEPPSPFLKILNFIGGAVHMRNGEAVISTRYPRCGYRGNSTAMSYSASRALQGPHSGQQHAGVLLHIFRILFSHIFFTQISNDVGISMLGVLPRLPEELQVLIHGVLLPP